MESPHLEHPRLVELLARLTLEEKVRLLTGRDSWTTWPITKIGLRRMLVSDGPSGVRGEVWDERSPSLNLPSATALSSSWDPDVAAAYGACVAAEARRKGVDVVLGPTINLHRSPLGGRHFEAFSEDPLLTAELAAAYVRGVQQNGVGATPKHYVANDSETERYTVDVVVGQRALRELYLLPFERAVVESRAWLVMSAYNSINGATATENDLLETPLNSEWGFDGVVISDWSAVRSLRSSQASQDLVMPGPEGPWGDTLVQAVRSGEIEEAAVDRKVLRLLLLAARVGALESFGTAANGTAPIEDRRVFARSAAAEGSVLLRNEGELPWDGETISRIAVIGQNASHARTQGGGSAMVVPEYVVSPLDGIRAAFPRAEVTYSLGAVVREGVSEFSPDSMTNPISGGAGAHVRFLDPDGAELFSEERFSSSVVYLQGTAPVDRWATCELTTRWTPAETGIVHLGFAAVGRGRVFVDGRLLLEEKLAPMGQDLGASLIAPPTASAEVGVAADTPIEVRVELENFRPDHLHHAMSITVGSGPPGADPDELIAAAAAAASQADVAVVVVGTNAAVEAEGFDRTSLALPGRQDDLVRAVAAANQRTVVVVNSGAPVLLPWRDNVPAVLLTYFGGQECGNALGDMLSGDREPGGRLPTTWADEEKEVPILDVVPQAGTLRYDEGVHVGYRAWLRSDARPAYWFGHGLGYTTWDVANVSLEWNDDRDAVTVVAEVTNTGRRAGKHVVQVYAERPNSTVERPVRWLVGFAVVRTSPNQTVASRVTLPLRTLAFWDAGWQYEPGFYTLRIGSSAVDLPMSATIEL